MINQKQNFLRDSRAFCVAPIFPKIIFAGVLVSLCVAPLPVSAESLWLKAGSGIQTHYGDHRAARPGDILTIVLSETVNATSTQETKANKDSTINDSVTSFLFPNSKLGTYKGQMPSSNMTASNQYDGKGNITYNQSVAAKASVLVVDILPNGNLAPLPSVQRPKFLCVGFQQRIFV